MFNNIVCDLKLLEIQPGTVISESGGKKGRKAFGRLLGTVKPGYREEDQPFDIFLLVFGDVLERVKTLDPQAGTIVRVVGTLYDVKRQDTDGEEVRYLQIIPSSVELSACAEANLCYLLAEGLVSESADKEVLKVYDEDNYCRFTVGTIPPGKAEQNWINLKCLCFHVERVKRMKLKKGSALRVCGVFSRQVFEKDEREIAYYELVVSHMEYYRKRPDEEKTGGKKVRDARDGEVPGV